jgi:sugar phosphate isomerase/epimerase
VSDLGARYAVCEGVLRQGSFARDAALAREAGFVAIGVDATAIDAIGVDEAARVLAGEGLRASSYLPLGDILRVDGPDDRGGSGLDEAARQLDVAARLGATGALVATGRLGARRQDEADAICRDWLARAGALAVERDVRIMLEPMHPLMRRWSYVHTTRDALALVRGIAGVGIALDLGHVWWEHGLEVRIREHVDEIVSVQVTNVDTAALEELRYERAPLEHGDVPVARLVSVLESSGYRGWYENEILAPVPRERRLEVLLASHAWFDALDVSTPSGGGSPGG